MSTLIEIKVLCTVQARVNRQYKYSPMRWLIAILMLHGNKLTAHSRALQVS